MAGLRLVPRDERFFELMEQAAGIAVEAADALQLMLTDTSQMPALRQRIVDLEHAGDAVIHQVMDRLNRTFVPPLDPEDIRALASHLDDIIDYIHAAAERLIMHQVTAPLANSLKLNQVLVDACKEVHNLVERLRELKERRRILAHCIEINRLENVGDQMYREALGELFLAGDPLELIRWKEIFDQVEQAIDACEDLADIVESLVIKHG